MSEPKCALIVDDETSRLGDVALRLLRLGIDVYYSKDPAEGWLLAQQEAARIRALLFPPTLAFEHVAEIAGCLSSKSAGAPVSLVTVGPRVDDEVCRELEKQGIQYALWEPFDDSALRAIVLQAMSPPQQEHSPRREPRLPTTLMARAFMGARRCDTVVSTLSFGGAFLETPKPFPEDTRVTVEIALPDGVLSAKARVAHARYTIDPNEPGRPIGMGVEFLELKPDAKQRLCSYLEGVSEQSGP